MMCMMDNGGDAFRKFRHPLGKIQLGSRIIHYKGWVFTTIHIFVSLNLNNNLVV